MGRPFVGVPLDSREGGGYSAYPWYGLRKNYCEVLIQAGAIPLPIPHTLNDVEIYGNLLHGLLLTGGGFDIDPALYGETPHPTVTLNRSRTAFEMAMVKVMEAHQKPILGICGGHQLLNVVRGGSLIQDIPSEVSSPICHTQTQDRHQSAHTVTVIKNTQLHRLMQKECIAVNSVHHQAVKDVGQGLVVNARSEDGLIEGIEDPTLPCFMGVQWHPEFTVTPHDQQLFKYFVEACRQRARGDT